MKSAIIKCKDCKHCCNTTVNYTLGGNPNVNYCDIPRDKSYSFIGQGESQISFIFDVIYDMESMLSTCPFNKEVPK